MGNLTLQETARRVAGYAWAEARLFEVLGGWVPTTPELEVKLWLVTQSSHHAWHAQLWRERLPALGAPTPEHPDTPAGSPPSLPISPSLAAVVDTVAEAPATLDRLVGAYRVLLPRLVGVYTAHLRACTPVSDGPVIRALTLVLRDEAEGWRDGELLVQSLLDSGARVREAADHQARLEADLVDSGLVEAGLVDSLPGSEGGRTQVGGAG